MKMFQACLVVALFVAWQLKPVNFNLLGGFGQNVEISYGRIIAAFLALILGYTIFF